MHIHTNTKKKGNTKSKMFYLGERDAKKFIKAIKAKM